MLAFVTNRSMEQQQVHLAFNLEALGLAGQNLEVRDTMYNRMLPMDADGNVTLNLDSERWTYLWLRPGGAHAGQ